MKVYQYTIVGVTKDFHFKDLHVPIEPYGFFLNNQPYYNYFIVHAATKDIGSLLAYAGNAWHKLNPTEPFEYSFLDEDFQKNYEAENRLLSIVGYFTVVAILFPVLVYLDLQHSVRSSGQKKLVSGKYWEQVRAISWASYRGISSSLS